MSERTVIGLNPWLPWPFSAWRWWTEPVRAERLAALRMGVAALLLFDILTSYLPNLHVYFGPEYFGQPDVSGYYGEAPRLNWSLLRGFKDPLLSSLAVTAWILSSGWLLVGLLGRVTAWTL